MKGLSIKERELVNLDCSVVIVTGGGVQKKA